MKDRKLSLLRNLLMLSAGLVQLLAFAGNAAAANQRYTVHMYDRWLDYFEQDGMAIAEGDIVLGRAEEIAILRDAHPDHRKALATFRTDILWPIGPSGLFEVPYTYESGANALQAIASFNATFAGLIQWVPRTTQVDYVAFNLANKANDTSGSCNSALGRMGGRQEIGGNFDCPVAFVLHEMGHALGLFHTHQSASADKFVRFSFATIDPARRSSYAPIHYGVQTDGYDYSSVMHYPYAGSSIGPDRNVFATIPAGIDIRNVNGYSAGDVDAIKRLYGTYSTATTIVTNPAGLDVIVDGQRRTTPYSVAWGLGSSHQISVPAELQSKDGYSFAFGRWSHDESAAPVSLQQWIVEPGLDRDGRPMNVPKVGVLTANFIRLIDVEPYVPGGPYGQYTVAPEVPAWAGSKNLYPQLTKFVLTATPDPGYLNFWYWEAADTLTGGSGGASQASLRIRADLPTQKVGVGFVAAPAILIQPTGPGVDGSVRVGLTYPDGSTKSLALPWAGKPPAGAYRLAVPTTIGRSESVRFALKGIDGLDDPATGSINVPTAGQSTKVVTVKLEKEFQPLVQVNPSCAGTVALSGQAAWLPVGANFSATATPIGGAIFAGWSGTASGSSPTIDATANVVPELIANFNSFAEPFTLSSVVPSRYFLGQGPQTFEMRGSGFSSETYVVINDVSTRPARFVDSHTLRVTLSDADLPGQRDISVNAGTHVAGSCFNFTASLGIAAVKAGDAGKSTVYEFYNASLDHYFITWAPDEITKLDNGAFAGWARTGKSFPVFTVAQPGLSSVCRIYIPPGKGDGHYFGRDKAECDGTMTKNPTFVLEASSFFYLIPANLGTCGAGSVPVYRVYSNRTDANHRYTTDRAVRDQMVAKGWLAEGDGPDTVVMCAPQ